jgi:hypothetical protein
VADPRRRRRIRGQRRGMGRRKPSGSLGEGGPHIQDEAPLQDRRVALGGRVLPSGSTLPNLPPRCTNEGWALSKGDPANNLRASRPRFCVPEGDK